MKRVTERHNEPRELDIQAAIDVEKQNVVEYVMV